MSNYRRNFVPGGCYFFTVNLLERKQNLLTEHIDLLRDSVRRVRWRFLDHPGLPLTNNAAQRALRPYVIWRKTHFASQSMRGLAFRERILSVIGTARNLGLNTHQLLRQLCHEGLQRRAITPLPLDQDHPSLPKAS